MVHLRLLQVAAGSYPTETAAATKGLLTPRVSTETKRDVLGILFSIIGATSAEHTTTALDALRQVPALSSAVRRPWVSGVPRD
jgi:hypothetical protein